MAAYEIRLFGDPVLKQRASEVGDVDGALVQLVDDMFETLDTAAGLGLAAPQVGVQKRLFVYQMLDGPRSVIVNPVITESRGEWTYDEGCLSIPGLYFEITRPNEIHLTGYDLEGNEISVEADELLGRLFQHELDHLDGVLLLERLEADERKQALRAWREQLVSGEPPPRRRRRGGPEL
jgi:peptide deformylase